MELGMQEDHTPGTFQIGQDDQENDVGMQAELQELKIEKLSQRVMLFTILIPCMIGIITIISYLDIKDRVSRTQSTGTIGVQKLSKELESKFSSLSLEQAKLKDIQTKKLPVLEKNTVFLQTRLKKAQQSIKNLETSKIERDELTRVVASLNAQYATIPEHLQNELDAFRTADQELKTEDNALAKQLGEMAEAFSQLSEKLSGLQSDISSVSATKIDKNELALALKLKEISFRQEILEAARSMEKKIQALQQQIDRQKKAQATAPAVQPKPVQPENQPEAAQTSPNPAPGSIEEQTIE